MCFYDKYIMYHLMVNTQYYFYSIYVGFGILYLLAYIDACMLGLHNALLIV